MKETLKNKGKKKLSGKKFLFIILIVLSLFVIIALFFLLSKKENFFSNKQPNFENETIISLMQTDTDNDGILDWEEALWGTDKNNPTTFEGISDLDYIENQKSELQTEQATSNTRTTETEKFAREFFSAYTTMKAGGVDEATINSFANALGQQVVNPNLVDQYKMEDVKISAENTLEGGLVYYQNMQELFTRAQDSGAGDELAIVSQGLVDYNTTGIDNEFEELLVIAEAYQEFARQAIEISVPTDIKDLHLKIVNEANNTGISVQHMATIITDPVVGLSGLSQYQEYSENLVNAVADLETVLFQ